MRGWQFHLAFWPTVGLCALAPLLVALGLWQLDRAEQKHQRADAFKYNIQMPAVEIGVIMIAPAEETYWRKTSGRGVFLSPLIYLDNRSRDGRFGYEIISALHLDDGRKILINRGWMPGSPDRRVLPTVVSPSTKISFSGYLGPPPVSGIHFGTGEWPAEEVSPGNVRLQEIKTAELRQTFGPQLVDVMMYLDGDSDHGYRRDWLPPGDGAAKHEAYAIQWFSMAAILVGIYIWTHVRARIAA